jgi:hypothetical protein
MLSPEPMVVLHTRSASEGIPSRDSVYDQSQPYNICGAVRNAPSPQPRRRGVAHSAGPVPPPYAPMYSAGVASAETGVPCEQSSVREITYHSLIEMLTCLLVGNPAPSPPSPLPSYVCRPSSRPVPSRWYRGSPWAVVPYADPVCAPRLASQRVDADRRSRLPATARPGNRPWDMRRGDR